MKIPSSDGGQEQAGLPAFETLYKRYYTQVYRYLRAHLGEQDAADVLQHVFLQAWRQGHTYDASRGSVATWLLSIARHRVVDVYRGARPAVSFEMLPEMAAAEETPEAQMISAEAVALVKRLLEALPEAERELLALRFAARLSSGEIAALIGKSEAAAKKQLMRLVHRLHEQYRREALEDLLPDLLEPALPSFAAALMFVYMARMPERGLRAIGEQVLEQARSEG
jgi:RNA polymerase sigma-70 factor (ECF subfamily)